MNPLTRTLRIFQVVAILYVLVLFFLIPVKHKPAHAALAFQYAILIMAFVAVSASFTMQRMLARVKAKPEELTPGYQGSTPQRRWFAGQIFRLAAALSMSLFGFVLRQVGGLPWIIDLLFVASLVFLATWTPGQSPETLQSDSVLKQ